MIYNNADLIIEQAMVTVISTVRMLNDGILSEKDESLLNELQVSRDLLKKVLRELAADQSVGVDHLLGLFFFLISQFCAYSNHKKTICQPT